MKIKHRKVFKAEGSNIEIGKLTLWYCNDGWTKYYTICKKYLCRTVNVFQISFIDLLVYIVSIENKLVSFISVYIDETNRKQLKGNCMATMTFKANLLLSIHPLKWENRENIHDYLHLQYNDNLKVKGIYGFDHRNTKWKWNDRWCVWTETELSLFTPELENIPAFTS